MKKHLVIGALSVTAGMAAAVSFPQFALARSNQIEKSFAKKFALKMTSPARYTDDKGNKIEGFIYLNLEQTPLTPGYTNQLHGEMTGALYFESNEFTSEYNGQKYKTWIGITGDDGNVLLDLVSNDKKYHTYQVYGCSSTMNVCEGESIQVSIEEHNVSINLNLTADSNIEVLNTYQTTDKDGKVQIVKSWDKRSHNQNMVEVPVKD